MMITKVLGKKPIIKKKTIKRRKLKRIAGRKNKKL